jgi:hypothetical protein
MAITGLRQAAEGTVNLNCKSKTSEGAGGWIVGAATLAYTCTDAHRVKATSLYSNIAYICYWRKSILPEIRIGVHEHLTTKC